MNRNFTQSLALVLKHEGGWSDHPKDPGGATMKGVTLANFQRYVKPNATKADLRNITDAQLSMVYRKYYWDAVSANDLPDGLDYAVFDFAVNSGPSRAAKYLQKIVGVSQDGVIGPATLAAVSRHKAATLINKLCDDRMSFLRGLKTFPTFGKGWTSRVSGVRSAALNMAASAHSKPDTTVVERPVVADPGELEASPATSKTTLMSLFTMFAAPFAALGGLDWRVQLALLAVVVGFSVYAIKRRFDLASAVKKLRQDIG